MKNATTVPENVNTVNGNEEVFNEIKEKLLQLSDEARQELYEVITFIEKYDSNPEEFRAELEHRITLLEESQAS